MHHIGVSSTPYCTWSTTCEVVPKFRIYFILILLKIGTDTSSARHRSTAVLACARFRLCDKGASMATFVEALAPERFQRKIVKFLDQNGGTKLERADDRKQAKWMQACADKGFLFAMVFHRCVDGCCCVWRLCLAVPSLWLSVPVSIPVAVPVYGSLSCVDAAVLSLRLRLRLCLAVSLSMALCFCPCPWLSVPVAVLVAVPVYGALCLCFYLELYVSVSLRAHTHCVVAWQ